MIRAKYDDVVDISSQAWKPEAEWGFHVLIRVTGDEVKGVTFVSGDQERGFEKFFEKENAYMNLFRVARLSAQAPLSQELVFLKTLENILDITVPSRSQVIRVIFCEGERIISHLKALGLIAKSVGLGILLKLALDFKDQYEKLCFTFFQRRIFIGFFAIGGLRGPFSTKLLTLWVRFFEQSRDLLLVFQSVLLKNRNFRQRASQVGILSKDLALSLGLTGINARASGVLLDSRVMEADKVYASVDFRPILFQEGHAYSRTLLLFEEAQRSLQIMKQSLKDLPAETEASNLFFTDYQHHTISFHWAEQNYQAIDEGLYPVVQLYRSVENPYGELGCYIACDGSNRLYRCHFKKPSLQSMQAFEVLAPHHSLSNIDLLLASLNINPQEMDK
jgi:NADH-quinone oxidoreductase subunit D